MKNKKRKKVKTLPSPWTEAKQKNATIKLRYPDKEILRSRMMSVPLFEIVPDQHTVLV